jgi:hypothetical protein
MRVVLTKNTPAVNTGIGLLAVSNILVHIVFYNTLGFHRDELLYFSLGQHLAAGYASVPPMTGFTGWIMLHLIGPTLFAARLIPALVSGLYVVLAAAIARQLRGGAFAQLLAAFGVIVTSYNLRAFYLFQPVYMDIFFWGVILWLFLRWMNTGESRLLLYAGIVLGFALLNKYLILLEALSILAVFLFSPYRKIFRDRALYFAICLALLIFLPNIIWQINHHLPVLMHMDALQRSQLVHVNRFAFLTDQLFIATAAIVLVLPGIVDLLLNPRMSQYRQLLLASLLVVLLLVIIRGKSYYTLGLFVFWIAAGAVFWERAAQSPWARTGLVAGMALVTIVLVPMGIPVFKPVKLAGYFAGVKKTTGFDAVLRWETGRIHSLPQDYADMLGWEEMAAITAKAYDSVTDKNATMIYAENYGQAGTIMVIGKKYGLPEPTCFCESFFYWAPRRLDREITSFIYINDTLGDDVRPLFRDCRMVGRVSDTLARENGTQVWLCREPASSFKAFWERRVPQIKSPF